MSDIFNEVDEELRRSQLEQLWKKYGSYVIAAAVAVVVAVGGYRGWVYYQTKLSQAASTKFLDAVAAAAEGKHSDATAAFAALAREAPSGFAILSRFRHAGELGRNDSAAGAAAFKALAADSGIGPAMQELARLRAAMLSAEVAEPKDVIAELTPLAEAGRPWRNQARELLGALALKAGDFAAAGQWFDRIIVDPEAPTALRRRAQEFSAIVAAGALKPKS
jgi:hypothetical protein